MRASSSARLAARLWLPAAILTAAGLGLCAPAAGDWLSSHRAPSYLVPAIMLLVSLRVPGAQLLDALRHPLVLLGSLTLIYGVFPLVALAWQTLLGPAGPDPRAALIILAAQPSTLATATVLTHLAGGNAGLAVIATAASQVLSVVATPWILELYVGHAVPVDTWGLAWDLVRSVLLPVVAGQILRVPLRRWIERRSWALSLAAESMVVLFVWMGFSTAREILLQRPVVALTVLGTVVAIHATMLALSTGAGYLLRLDGAGRIAMTLASSQKTVAAGVLVWQSGFAANALGPIFVVLNHLVQTVADALLAPFMSRIRIGKRRLFPLTS
ncbi:MAG: bile acid:sodium symporter [Deltaproteobacteria bacterium]|nr:bile acid:sodium symporter [Deltaproteobacteria bacterium]